MAVFEKKITRKVCIDDTETLTVTIENAQNVQGHTVSVTLNVKNSILCFNNKSITPFKKKN